MAFDLNSLKPISQAGQGNSDIWIYKSADALSVIRFVGYFNNASRQLNINDTILVISATGGTPVHSWNIVNANAAGVVDVTDGDVIDATDTD